MNCGAALSKAAMGYVSTCIGDHLSPRPAVGFFGLVFYGTSIGSVCG